MNANEATATRELTELNGGSRELTVDELNTAAGGSRLIAEMMHYYSFSLGVLNFYGDITNHCVSWRTANGGLEGVCYRP
jgi:hypothetical protein